MTSNASGNNDTNYNMAYVRKKIILNDIIARPCIVSKDQIVFWGYQYMHGLRWNKAMTQYYHFKQLSELDMGTYCTREYIPQNCIYLFIQCMRSTITWVLVCQVSRSD